MGLSSHDQVYHLCLLISKKYDILVYAHALFRVSSLVAKVQPLKPFKTF